jgi:hypothetical protein
MQSGPLSTLEVELDPYFISMYDMTVCVVRRGMGRDIYEVKYVGTTEDFVTLCIWKDRINLLRGATAREGGREEAVQVK